MDEEYNKRDMSAKLREVLNKAEKLSKIRLAQVKETEYDDLKKYMSIALASNTSLLTDINTYIDKKQAYTGIVNDAPSHLECSISLVWYCMTVGAVQ